MKNKRYFSFSLFDSSNECVYSRVVSSRSAFEAFVTFVYTLWVSIGRDVYSRLADGEFTVSCCPYVDSDSLGGD